MRSQHRLLALVALISTIYALVLPASFPDFTESTTALFKRKGGGGGGGKGGGDSSSGGSSSGSSSGSSGGSSGGRSASGSGTMPTYGSGGRYYGGGASVPYSAGARSPGGIAPYLLTGAALGVLPGLWLYGAWAYPYSFPYTYHNNTSNQNETHPVQCLCGQYAECGCDNNNDTSYIDSVVNDASAAQLANLNGTQTLVINGTLDNGTTASGGTSAAGSFRQSFAGTCGWWMVALGVVYTTLYF